MLGGGLLRAASGLCTRTLVPTGMLLPHYWAEAEQRLQPHLVERSHPLTLGLQRAHLQSVESRVQSAECRVQGAECRAQSAECRVQGAEQRTSAHIVELQYCPTVYCPSILRSY